MSDTQLEVYYESDENGDWYTAIIDEMVYQMNGNPSHPQGGVSQFIGTIGDNGLVRDNLGDEIDFEDCPEAVQEAINDRAPDGVQF